MIKIAYPGGVTDSLNVAIVRFSEYGPFGRKGVLIYNRIKGIAKIEKKVLLKVMIFEKFLIFEKSIRGSMYLWRIKVYKITRNYPLSRIVTA